jgi:hypothetical protein
MRSKSGRTHAPRRVAPIHALFGAALLGLLVMPIAFAGANSHEARASGSSKAQIKSLKRRLAGLEIRTSALERKPAPPIPSTPTALPPSGPAGGVLTGSYPAPSALAANSVGPTQIVNQAVGAGQLKSTYERVSEGIHAAANTFADATASCNAGDHVLGGGYAWQNQPGIDQRNNNNNNVTSTDTVSSTPNRSDNTFGDNPDQWIVEARSNVDNTLFAWAVCLRA